MPDITQLIRKALELYTRAIKLGNKKLAREIGELIDDLSDIQFYGLDYEPIEVGNRIAYFERRLSILEESRGE